MLQAYVLLCVVFFCQPVLLPFVPYSDAELYDTKMLSLTCHFLNLFLSHI